VVDLEACVQRVTWVRFRSPPRVAETDTLSVRCPQVRRTAVGRKRLHEWATGGARMRRLGTKALSGRIYGNFC